MAVYKTYKCPYCKHVLSRNERTYWNHYDKDIGNPIAYCINCYKPYKTGKQWWKDISKGRRSVIFIKVIVTVFMTPLYVSVVLGLIGFLIASLFSKSSEYSDFLSENFIVVILSYALVFIIMLWFNLKWFADAISEENIKWKVDKSKF